MADLFCMNMDGACADMTVAILHEGYVRGIFLEYKLGTTLAESNVSNYLTDDFLKLARSVKRSFYLIDCMKSIAVRIKRTARGCGGLFIINIKVFVIVPRHVSYGT